MSQFCFVFNQAVLTWGIRVSASVMELLVGTRRNVVWYHQLPLELDISLFQEGRLKVSDGRTRWTGE